MSKHSQKINSNTGECPKVTNIQLVGYFSIASENNERIYKPDCSMLRYFKPPQNYNHLKFDLNTTLHEDKMTNKEEKLTFMLKWIKQNFPNIFTKDINRHWKKPDFISFRGTFNKILCSPYEDFNGWIICACKFQGIIYLSLFKTDEEKQKIESRSETVENFLKWGFKFEQYVFSDSPDCEPDFTKPVSNTDEFCCIFKSQFGKFKLLYGAEIDGVISDKKIDNILKQNVEFVEVKTNGDKNDHTLQNCLRNKNKYVKWWGQSYLVNIPHIVCGFRNNKGIITSMMNLHLSTLEKFVRKIDKCHRFALQTLTFIYDSVVKNYDECIYKFSYDLHHKDIISMEELSPDDQNYAFLTSDFIKEAVNFKKTNNELFD